MSEKNYNKNLSQLLFQNIFSKSRSYSLIDDKQDKQDSIIKKFFTNPSNLLIVLLNALFFMIIQIFFFYFLAANQIDDILISKVSLINKYAEYDGSLNNYLKEYINSEEFKKKTQENKELNEERQRKNRNLIIERVVYTFIIPISVILFIVLIIIAIPFPTNQKMFGDKINKEDFSLNRGDVILICFVIFAFLTELIIYFGIFKQYEFIGSFVALNEIYRKVADNYNKNI